MFKKLSKFLALLTLLPVIMLIISMLYSTSSSISGYLDASATTNRAKVVKELNNLVHQVQLERGLTAAYLGSDTNEFSSRLSIQRKSADNQWQKIASFEEIIKSEAFMTETHNKLKSQWANVSSYRKNIDNRDIPLGDALRYYTGINKTILDNNYHVSRLIQDPDLSAKMSVAANISYVKEYAGIERAVLSNGFAKNDFNIALYTRFISLLATQNVFLSNAKNFANDDLLNQLNAFENGEATKDVERFRTLARNSQADKPNTSASNWFAAATKRIEQAKALESGLLSEIEQLASGIKTYSTYKTLVLILVMIFVLALATFIYVSMRRRQRQANLILQSAAQLKNDHDISHTIPIVIEDNIGGIARALNDAFQQLSNDILEFQQSAIEIASAAEQAAATTNKSNDNLSRQENAVLKLKQFTDSVNTSITSDLDDIKLANQAALEAKQRAQQGSVHVDETVVSIQASAKTLNSVGNSVHNLNERVKDIEGMVEMIRSVAEQTNLLALNAAIEAARAGEQGRGFAVVADEVRSLAQRTQENTQKIADIVEELTKSSDDANKTIDSSVNEINQCVSKSESITKVLAEVVEGMEKLEGMMHTVNDSAKDQASQVASMNLQVDDIGEAAHENSSDAELMASTAVQLSSVASSMKTRTDEYKLA